MVATCAHMCVRRRPMFHMMDVHLLLVRQTKPLIRKLPNWDRQGLRAYVWLTASEEWLSFQLPTSFMKKKIEKDKSRVDSRRVIASCGCWPLVLPTRRSLALLAALWPTSAPSLSSRKYDLSFFLSFSVTSPDGHVIICSTLWNVRVEMDSSTCMHEYRVYTARIISFICKFGWPAMALGGPSMVGVGFDTRLLSPSLASTSYTILHPSFIYFAPFFFHATYTGWSSHLR
jgi:hypothetical protein